MICNRCNTTYATSEHETCPDCYADNGTDTICHARYIHALETEQWYLLSMDAITGAWVVEVQYLDAQNMVGEDGTGVRVAHRADHWVHKEVSEGRWAADRLQEAFEVAIVVPGHVAGKLIPELR